MRELNDHERNMVAKIDEYGYFKLMVFDPEGNDPHFMYSVGFQQTHEQPECIIIGLSRDLMEAMMDVLHDKLEKGLKLVDALLIEDLLGGGFKCMAKTVKPENLSRAYFNSARWYNRYCGGTNDEFQAMQIIWPGAIDGLYPWQSEQMSALQPLLCEPPASP